MTDGRKFPRAAAALDKVRGQLLQKGQQIRALGSEQIDFLELQKFSKLQKIGLVGLRRKRREPLLHLYIREKRRERLLVGHLHHCRPQPSAVAATFLRSKRQGKANSNT